ncbi:MAG: hypothetical protein ACI3XX_07440, partial [Eubacteriales bacterium]
MEYTDISLMYPTQEALMKNARGEDKAKISNEVLDELGLNSIIDLKNSRLCDFFTLDPEVIAYRQRVFADTVENPELCELLVKLNPILSDIAEIRR